MCRPAAPNLRSPLEAAGRAPAFQAVALVAAIGLLAGAGAHAVAQRMHPRSGAHRWSGAHRRSGAHRLDRRRHTHKARGAVRLKGGVLYSGSGADYLNNSPRWIREAKGSISFKTSSDGRRIEDFKGTLSFACEIGTSYVSAKYLQVSRTGSFSYRFSSPTKAADGRVYGHQYVAIYGRFLSPAKRASVGYLVDEVVKEKPVSHPYDTAHPSALGCASWVRGVVYAR